MMGLKNFYINKKSKGWLKILVGATIFFVVVFILGLFTTPIKNYFYALSAPIQKTFWSAGTISSNFFGSFLKAGSLAKENEDLQKENRELLSQVAILQSIDEANQAQNDVSLACQNSGFSLVPAKSSGLVNDVLSVDKGSADGISVGMTVIDQQKVLVGKIFEVYQNFSQIMLISNKNSTVVIKTLQSDQLASEVSGAVKGSGGLSAYLDLIRIQDTISQGDVLVTSNDPVFPNDLLVGKIDKVQKNDQKSFQSASIQLFFNVKTVDNLFVITNYKKE